jgi:hypothetical protein
MVIGSSTGFWCLILQAVSHQTRGKKAYSVSAAVKRKRRRETATPLP